MLRISSWNGFSTQIARNLFCPYLIAELPNRFEILHRAWRYDTRALCKFYKWFHNCMCALDILGFAFLKWVSDGYPILWLLQLVWDYVAALDYIDNLARTSLATNRHQTVGKRHGLPRSTGAISTYHPHIDSWMQKIRNSIALARVTSLLH